MPLPSRWRELQDWADALDEGVEEKNRVAPGALMDLCKKGETVRQGFARRLIETPGVVATSENELGSSLVVSHRMVDVPNSVYLALKKLRDTWETPNGDLITEAVDLWRHARELACGFWYQWDPPPPLEWMKRRKKWKKFVREILKHNRRGLDTELQVWNECANQENPVKEFSEWRDIKDLFKINTVPRWISDYLISDAAAWTAEGDGIVWVDHRAFGEKLSEYTALRYFGAGTKASIDILSASGPIIASIAAHSDGKNLQHYSRNLIISPPPSGQRWEQMLGRTHREGQRADEVTCEVYLQTDESIASFRKAYADARYLEETLGNRQKLLYCDFDAEICKRLLQ